MKELPVTRAFPDHGPSKPNPNWLGKLWEGKIESKVADVCLQLSLYYIDMSVTKNDSNVTIIIAAHYVVN